MSIGGVNIDLCVQVAEFPEIDSEVEAGRIDEYPGGSAANYIVGVARLGLNSGFIGKVGADNSGRRLLDDFIGENVDISQIRIDQNSHTGMCLIPIDRNGNRQIFSFRGANANLNPNDINEIYIKQASLLHITSPPIEVSKFVAKIARKNGITLSYDPGGKVVRKGLGYIAPVLQNTDIFFPSHSELSLLYPEITNPVIAAQQLIEDYHIKIVVVKFGAQGCIIFTSTQKIKMQGFRVKVLDTTGAGDSFAATFTAGFLKGWDLSRCATFANAAGAISVTKFGARTALPTLQEIEHFLALKNEK
ncbi:MAG: carbohydrate kinase family protein [Candidatus Helarchaeota archaeon]